MKANLRALDLSLPAPDGDAWVTRALLVSGITLLLCGATALLTFNGAEMSPFGELLVLQAALAAFLACALLLASSQLARQAMLLSACVLNGALLIALDHAYPGETDAYQLFMLWTTFALGWALAAKMALLWLLWLAGLNIFLFLWWMQSSSAGAGMGAAVCIGLAILNGSALLLQDRLRSRPGWGWLQRVWLRPALVAAALLPLLALCLLLAYEPGKSTFSWVAAAGAAVFGHGLAYTWLRGRAGDPWASIVPVLSASVIAVVAGLWFVDWVLTSVENSVRSSALFLACVALTISATIGSFLTAATLVRRLETASAAGRSGRLPRLSASEPAVSPSGRGADDEADDSARGSITEEQRSGVLPASFRCLALAGGVATLILTFLWVFVAINNQRNLGFDWPFFSGPFFLVAAITLQAVYTAGGKIALKFLALALVVPGTVLCMALIFIIGGIAAKGDVDTLVAISAVGLLFAFVAAIIFSAFRESEVRAICFSVLLCFPLLIGPQGAPADLEGLLLPGYILALSAGTALIVAFGKSGRIYDPLRYGMLVTLCFAALSLSSGPRDAAAIIVASLLFAACLTALAAHAAGGAGRLLSRRGLQACSGILALALLAGSAPGILLAAALMALGHMRRERLSLVMGALLLPATGILHCLNPEISTPEKLAPLAAGMLALLAGLVRSSGGSAGRGALSVGTWRTIAWSAMFFASLNYTIYSRQQLKEHGEPVLLELATPDPGPPERRGRMELRYGMEEEASSLESASGADRSGYLVVESDDDNVSRFVRFHGGEELDRRERLIAYRKTRDSLFSHHLFRLRNLSAHGEPDVDILAMPQSFHFQPGHEEHYRGAKFAVFRFDGSDDYVLAGLADIDGEMLGPPD